MTKKIIAIVLLVIGALGAIVLLTYGGPVLPHIIGPIVVAAIGAFLWFYKKKAVK
jgi:hypothetical protein